MALIQKLITYIKRVSAKTKPVKSNSNLVGIEMIGLDGDDGSYIVEHHKNPNRTKTIKPYYEHPNIQN